MVLLLFGPAGTAPFASALAGNAPTAADYLVFETTLDGKCHILSEGGKLTLMKNTHPTKSIHYRLERLFADRPQGLMDGSISAADGAQKLGCDKVGGRPQRWRVKRATFMQKAEP